MITEKRELKNVPLTDLIPYARNPRKNDPAVQRIAASLKEYGLVKNSIVVDEEMVLITGHTTMKAMQALKWEAAPEVTQVFGLTEAQKKAYRIADNKLGELAAWDEELLALEFEDLKGLDFDVDLTGFDTKELAKILDAEKEATDDDFEPPATVETDIQRGDLFRLGQHRLLCGDSTSAEDVARLMGGAKADMVFTDPPYNVDYTGKTADALTIQNDKMEGEAFRAFLTDAFARMVESSKPGAPAYVCHSDTEGYNFRGAFADAGWLLKQCIIWEKQHFVMGRQDYQWQHEPILYGWKPGSHLFYGGRNLTTIWKVDRPMASREHPTMKPVALVAQAVKNSTKGEDIVLDLFLGSGTTLIACEQLGRTCYGMEISPQYCQVIIDRWEKLTGQKAEKVDES
jgi:site-specific DNA-methyltransferase (adenine-specific)